MTQRLLIARSDAKMR